MSYFVNSDLSRILTYLLYQRSKTATPISISEDEIVEDSDGDVPMSLSVAPQANPTAVVESDIDELEEEEEEEEEEESDIEESEEEEPAPVRQSSRKKKSAPAKQVKKKPSKAAVKKELVVESDEEIESEPPKKKKTKAKAKAKAKASVPVISYAVPPRVSYPPWQPASTDARGVIDRSWLITRKLPRLILLLSCSNNFYFNPRTSLGNGRDRRRRRVSPSNGKSRL